MIAFLEALGGATGVVAILKGLEAIQKARTPASQRFENIIQELAKDVAEVKIYLALQRDDRDAATHLWGKFIDSGKKCETLRIRLTQKGWL